MKSVLVLIVRSQCPKSPVHQLKVGDYVLFNYTKDTLGIKHNVWCTGLITEVGSSQNSTTMISTLAREVATSDVAKIAEVWSITDHNTTRVLDELVLVSTKYDVASPIGSDKHRQRERTADQHKLAGKSAE